jgi:hypothetical protein
MNSTFTFFVGIIVQIVLAILQVTVLVIFVYRWQKNSWRFSNIMKIREPLARAYCSLSAVARARVRLAEDAADPAKSGHDHERLHQYLVATQDEIVNFSVEHFKARFWMMEAENRQLDLLFDRLRDAWSQMRNATCDADALLDDLRREIMRFDDICGLKNYNGGQWSHVALHA